MRELSQQGSRAAGHRIDGTAFRSGWTRLEEAAEGRLHIRPPEGAEAALRRDYDAMAGMIMGEAPGFEWVLSRIGEIADLYGSKARR